MAQERYIDADKLVALINTMYIGMPTVPVPYNSMGTASMDAAIANMINNQIVTAVNSTLWQFKQELAKAVEACATLKGTPCFLCKQRDGDELPENVYQGCGTRSAA